MKPTSEERPTEPQAMRDRDDWQTFVANLEDYAIFLLDADGNVASWNRGAARIKGYAADEILGRHFSAFYTTEDVAAQKPERTLATALRDGHFEDEGYRLRRDGSRFWAKVVITALRNGSGDLLGFAKITCDLTTRREAEVELRRSEERFRLLVDAVQDYAIFMLDADGRVATWNRGAQAIKGYAAEEIIGRHFSSFYPEAEIARGKPARELEVAREVGRLEDEGWRVRKDGSQFWANVVITALWDDERQLRGFAKVTRDLTDRVHAEQTARELVREQAARAAAEAAEARIREAARAAEEAARAASEANRVKDEFLATVSHELRTPLNAMVGWASLLRTRTHDAALAKGLDVIHRNALAQGRIIEDILDVSRIITGKLRLDLQPTDLVAIVHDAIEVVRPAVTAKGLTIEFTLPESECLLLADPERLRQIVWNLLSNATKFSATGGHIEVSIEMSGTHFALRVKDTGQGIDPEFLPFVFDRFKQADSSATRRVGGLGLGLAIVRHLVELHGGLVHAESAGIGRGATFTITLPLRRQIAAGGLPSTGAATHADAAARPLASQRVLVVDDEEDARDLLVTILSGAGAVVETASSAAQGFEVLQVFRPSVLISDIGMPDEDGYALMRRVRALDPARGGGIPSIALTAYTRADDRTRALTMGFTTHIGKPVNPDDLVSAVARLAALGLLPSGPRRAGT